jgi:hypothetical protein
MNRTRAAGGAALVALTVAVLAGCGGSAQGKSSNRTEFTDKFGRNCTQVDPPGKAIALDCDYPPAENRLGDALNGLVNP